MQSRLDGRDLEIYEFTMTRSYNFTYIHLQTSRILNSVLSLDTFGYVYVSDG